MNNMNLQQMMKQAKKMQKDLMNKQEALSKKTFVGTEPSKMIEIEMNGEKKVTAIHLKKDVVDPEDLEMLQDLLLTAFNDASSKVDEASNKEFGSLTKGIPGL